MSATHTLTLREARSDDAEAILQLWRDAGATPGITDAPDQIRRAIAADPLSAFVAVDSDRIAGSIFAGFDGWRGNLYRLAVHPEYRRQGIARALVLQAETRLRSQGALRITALVEQHHPWAVRFWQAVGYTADPHMKRYIACL